MNKIIGNTVGMGLPKPNLKQTDPRKGDFVKGKDKIPSKVSQLENDSGYLTEHQSLTEYAKKTDIPTTLPASDVSAWAKASSKPSYSKSEVGLGNVDNVKQYSASNPPPYPVTSVNGKTGAVTVDVPTVPTMAMTRVEYSALTKESVEQLYADGIRMIIVEDARENLVHSAVSANGGVYNGCGYMNGIRLNSSGEIVTSRQSCVTGFIPFTYGQKLSVYGSKGPLGTPGQYVAAYDDAFALKGVIYMESLSGITATADENNIYTFTANTTQTMFNGASYIRISLNPCEGRDIIVQLGGDAE